MASTYRCFSAVMRRTRLLHAVIDFFFPPRCLVCGTGIGSYREGHFCRKCLDRFPVVASPLCPRCGMLFASRQGGDHFCSRCLRQEYFFDAARAVARYDGAMRETIHRFKYRGQTMLAGPLGRLMADRGSRLLPPGGYDLMVPVPLHVRRLRERGYNQSALLARSIGRCWQVPVNCTALTKTRWTKPQARLPLAERRRNLRGAFSWTGAALDGARIVLVDDVATTGATMNECARALKRAGAALVDVLALARTQQEFFS